MTAFNRTPLERFTNELHTARRDTNPKRERGFRKRSPRSRFGLVWPIGYPSENRPRGTADVQASVPAKSELEVARIVWERGGATVRQVLDALPEERGLDFKTVQTYLRRLEAKGYLQTHREGRSNVYRPIIRPGQVIGEVLDDLLSWLFDG
jgi:predicted transcriptional regulator